MRAQRLLFLLIIGLFVVESPGMGVGLSADDAAGRSLILKALERFAWYDEQYFGSRRRSLMTREVRRFDGDGEVEESDQGDYEVFPIDGAPYNRRLTINGRSLSDEEQGWEAEREAEFREELQRIRNEENEPDEDEDEVVFNEQLMERYEFTLVGEETWRNRVTHRISFQPRQGDLPVRRNIDHALNNTQGQVWVDAETFEVARMEFELIDRVPLWWGVLGTIYEARGSLDRSPVIDDTWGQIQYETYSDIRVLFKRTRRAELQQWRQFELIEE